MKLTLALLLLLPTTAAFAQPTRGLAWAWVSATGSSSTPDPGYQYNSATGVITVTWDTIGTYIVNIPNMANSITGNQGTAHAVAYNGNHHCHVTGWIASATAPTTTQTVTVQCYDPAGNRFNGQFYVLYQRESRTATEWNDAYLWADRPTLANYTPDVLFNWNSKGTANTMTRSGAGRYRAILTGLNSKVKHFGNVMVDTYGSSNGTHCQSTGWGQVGADQYVDIACNTPAGVANDTRFQLSFFSDVAFGVQTGDQQLRGAFLLADQPTAPAAYVPTLLNNYNSTGGLNRITRQSAGTYLVEIPGVLAVNSATVQVREFNAAGYCGLGVRPANQPLGGASVIVTCFSYAGAPADLQFNLLYLTNQSAAAALPAAGGPDRAKGWLSSVSNYNSTGAANSSTAIGTGVYRVSFPNLGTNGGIAYVNASANNNYCQPVIWGSNGTTQDVYVMCYAPDGTLVNATFNTLFYKESRVTTAWNSGYAKANLPISEVAYNALSNDSWNAKNSQNTVSRVSEGSYLVTFPGVGAAGGNVLIAPQGVVPTRCKVSSWQQSGADGTVSVSCYNIFGSPQDSEFTASYFNDVAFATDLASNAHQGGYVLASNSASASYTPTAAYSSTGGAILVTRSTAGTYNVHFDQMSASSTIPLVTATTTRLGDYCATGTTTAGSNSGVDIAVNCFNNAGTLADAQFALTYLTSQAPPPIFSVIAAHSGTFLQGTNQSFTVSVSNSASAATSSGTLTLNFNLPASYSFSAASGSSWTCSSTSCTYPNAVAPGSSAPTVTLQVNVSASATPGSSTAFTPSLSGGGSTGQVNGSDTPTIIATTVTTVSAISNLTTSAAAQSLPVSATVTAATSGTVTFTASNGSSTTATVSNATASGTLTIPANQAAGAYTVTAVYSGAGLYNGSSSAAQSFSILAPAPTPLLSIAKSHTGNFNQGQSGTWTLLVSNSSTASTTGALVTVTDTLPNGFTLASSNGSGWSCSGTTSVTCTSSLVITGAFPALNLVVAVPANAPSSVSNTAQVYGGGDVNHGGPGTAASSNTDTVTVIAPPPPVSVTINSVPQAKTFNVAGAGCGVGSYTTPQALSWTPGAACTVAFATPQGATVFQRWEDNSTNATRTISAPASATTYTATFGTIQGTTPAVVSLSPASGDTSSQSFSSVFTDPAGYTNLDVLNILINNFLDGRKACYLAYSRPANILFLVADDGATLMPGIVLNGSGTLSNSQCTITGAGSFATGSGNALTLNLNIAFSTSFAGDRIAYLAARNVTSGNSDWNVRGVWRVPGAAATPALSVSNFTPATGTGTSAVFTATFTDNAGGANISNAQILINSALNGDAACYLGYVRSTNQLFLVADGGPSTPLLGPITPGSGTGSMSNSQCTVTGAGTTSVTSGTTLTLGVNVTFKPGFTGYKLAYAAAQNASSANTDWHASSAWLVQ